MKKKPGARNSSLSEVYKNPLSQALGMVLRKFRLKLHPEPNAVADALDVQPSYYRAVEAGTYNLHISNSLKLYNAFSGKFSYEAIQKMLSTMAIIDSMTKQVSNSGENYYSNFYQSFKELGENDERIEELFQKFTANDFLTLIRGLSHDEVSQAIIKNGLDLVVENFLTNYKSFGKSPITIQDSFPNVFFSNVPTDKIDLFKKIKEYTLLQPSSYDYRMSWDWEDKNKEQFKNCYILDSNPEILTSYANLSKYQYEYLWEVTFEKLHILLISENSPESWMAKFSANLKKALNDSKKQTHLTHFKSAMQKVEIKCISSLPEIRSAEEILNPDGGVKYNATWVFALTDNFNVGVRAFINNSDARLTVGDYLKFGETLKMLRGFLPLWNRL
ncbi:MAG: hypothetical protein U0T75_02005 [Chitinophagales bacterium]